MAQAVAGATKMNQEKDLETEVPSVYMRKNSQDNLDQSQCHSDLAI